VDLNLRSAIRRSSASRPCLTFGWVHQLSESNHSRSFPKMVGTAMNVRFRPAGAGRCSRGIFR